MKSNRLFPISTVRMLPLAALAIASLTISILAAEPADLVVTLQGSDSTGSFSHGNNYPSVTLPFAMNAWSPYTQPCRDSFFYQYRETRLRGLRQTHQPSPWIGDYGAFSVMPVSGDLVCDENARASEFNHKNEDARPYFYKVLLEK